MSNKTRRNAKAHLDQLRERHARIWGAPKIPEDSPAGKGGLARKARRAKWAYDGLTFIEYLSQRVRYRKDNPNKYQKGPPGSDNR